MYRSSLVFACLSISYFGDGGRASVVAGDSGLNRALCVHDPAKKDRHEHE
jgi:hypothetical protein